MNFKEFRLLHPARDPDLAQKRSDDELRKMTAGDHLFLWKDLPKTESVEDRFSLDSFDLEKRPAIESRKMLWVIGKDECVYAKERGFFGKACSRKRLPKASACLLQ